jgi:hypothetical protein
LDNTILLTEGAIVFQPPEKSPRQLVCDFDLLPRRPILLSQLIGPGVSSFDLGAWALKVTSEVRCVESVVDKSGAEPSSLEGFLNPLLNFLQRSFALYVQRSLHHISAR